MNNIDFERYQFESGINITIFGSKLTDVDRSVIRHKLELLLSKTCVYDSKNDEFVGADFFKKNYKD